MATQLAYYLKRLGAGFSTWNRILSPEELYTKAVPAHRVLLAISDQSISPFIDENEAVFKEKFIVHFSATHSDSRALGFHPLGAFTGGDEIDFAKVHFHGVHLESKFREALPMFHNTYKKLEPEELQLYHALCVVGANYTSLLWKSFYKEMLALGISKNALDNFVNLSTSNVVKDPEKSVTGPLMRNDEQTLGKNLAALSDKPELFEIYQSFIKVFRNSGEEKNKTSAETLPWSNP